MHYWLVKSEGDCYSIKDLKRDKTTPWTGVRNFQARNFMRSMSKGDQVLFYHSSSKPTGVYGLAKVHKAAAADETQFDLSSEYYDSRATSEKPIWECVNLQFVKEFARPLTLTAIKTDQHLNGIMVAQPGSRLSVQPVSQEHFERIIKLIEKEQQQ